MGLFDNIRKKTKIEKQVKNYFELMNAYRPAFTSFEGGVYEMELTRAAIHCIATHCSKLKPEVTGKGNETFARRIQQAPNPHMVASQYLYKLATTLMVENSAFIIPLYADDMKTVTGFYPVNPRNVELIEYNGREYFRFRFPAGVAAVEREKVGVLNQYLYNSDFFGEDNRVLQPTMELINTNNQGIVEGVQNSAFIRFIAKLAMTLNGDDIEKERRRLTESNLSSANNGGVMMIDQKYESMQQVQSQQFTVNAEQMAQIKENVFSYFGVNEAILQNRFTSDQWAAFYEGKIEPFALQASLVHTQMAFSDTAQAYGNQIIFTSNRLEYLSPTEKLNTVTQLFDRGFITTNQGLEIYNMAPVEGGDKRYIRKEYAEAQEIGKKDDNTEEGGEGNAGEEGTTVQDGAATTD